FHSLSSRILRQHAELAGLQNRNFTIIDEGDAQSLMVEAAKVDRAFGPFVSPDGATDPEIKALKKEYDANLKAFVSKAMRQVSLWKSWGLTDVEASDPSRAQRSFQEEQFAAAYSSYQYELERRNMVDFGDLILKVV